MFRGLRDVFLNDNDIIALIDVGNLSEIDELDDEIEGNELEENEDIIQPLLYTEVQDDLAEALVGDDIFAVPGNTSDNISVMDFDVQGDGGPEAVSDFNPIIPATSNTPEPLEPVMVSTCQTLDQAVSEYFLKKQLTPKKEIKWRTIDGFETVNEQFYEPPQPDLTELSSPLEYFEK
ncbi:hypothetical protein J6590_002006 [Homalodisca vitripennis]|nr:hypothetical protein J6590_002006 [Homalodisca vitripennis]